MWYGSASALSEGHRFAQHRYLEDLMASLVDSVMQQLESRGAIDQIAGKLGVQPGQANSAIAAGLPAILAGLAPRRTAPKALQPSLAR